MKRKKFTTENFINRLKELYGDTYDYSKIEYYHHLRETILGCHTHGDVLVTPKQLLFSKNKLGCPKCGTELRFKSSAFTKLSLSKTTFVEKSNIKHQYKYNYDKVVYENSKSKVIITCKFHGDFLQTPAMHLSGNGCKKCAVEASIKRSSKDFSTFVKDANVIHNYLYTYSEYDYFGARTPTAIICKIHGIFYSTPDNHLNKKSGCPKCVHQISSEELKLEEKFPFFEKTNRSIIAPYHLDLYSKIHNLAIEVNGRYWHSQENGKDISYHIRKTEKCLVKGVSLLHFWDDEVNKKFPILESMINSRIGYADTIYARKTIVVSPSKDEVKKFLNETHLQGYLKYTVAYGLMFDNELIAVMTFGKPRFNKHVEWEIIRFSTKLNVSIVGGASKLFNAFIKQFDPKNIITYSDRRYSEGKVYEKLGFFFSHNSKPNYFYTKGEVNIPRYSAQKRKLNNLLGDKFNPTLSETENMLANGFVKVYDCGNKVFLWNKSQIVPLD